MSASLLGLRVFGSVLIKKHKRFATKHRVLFVLTRCLLTWVRSRQLRWRTHRCSKGGEIHPAHGMRCKSTAGERMMKMLSANVSVTAGRWPATSSQSSRLHLADSDFCTSAGGRSSGWSTANSRPSRGCWVLMTKAFGEVIG